MGTVHRTKIVVVLAVVFLAGGNAHEAFDKAFRQFLHEHGYRGGAVGALKDGRLVLAKGYGVKHDGTEVKTGGRFPVSSISKSITAVAVLRLVQDGLLDLEDTVFGPQGILHTLTPLNKEWVDHKIRDITVGHLLRHSGGWDQNKGPIFDPVLNEVYHSRGQHVPSISKTMDVPPPLDAATLIRFAISQPLDFTPGTKAVYSNLGYLVLGRVVEETSGLAYEEYVKKFVLNPCGMWHTRVGDPYTAHVLEVPEGKVPASESGHSPPELPLLDLLDSRTVDSTLGWYSTVYDVMRFARCVFDGDRVLNDESLEALLQKQEIEGGPHSPDMWFCAGFHAGAKNVVWQEGDANADDIILYRNLKPDGQQQLPDTWVVMLYGHKLQRLRHKTRVLMGQLGDWLATESSSPLRNLFARDLSDVDAMDDDVLVRFRVDEHHLDAYVSAVQREGYDIRWISPYTHRHHTSFLLVSHRLDVVTASDAAAARSASDFKLDHGLSEDQLLSHKLHMENQGYNITFLQSYHSQSHEAGDCFMAIFRKNAFTSQAQLKYGTDHLPEPYDKLVQMYHEEHFRPLVQSVLPHKGEEEEHFSFIFLQVPGEKPVDFKNYYRLPEARLEPTIVLNSRQGRTLAFLDSYELEGKARFAAVFTNETKARWLFKGGLLQEQAALLIETKLPSDLWPKLIVAHADKNSSEVKFSVFLLSQREDGQTARMDTYLMDHLLPEEESTGSLKRVVVDGSNI
ncbi:uncharacterized protein LOC112577254 [Pomacea canaliculata]|uniref:uncharacterized protein LOC112577254 n=1 Tax=Pomacea canaliculata TaxID=400727 RepID=UPI000D72E49B|nr:uncharacterized protein LOC112577254 [Pomacea canaliculata]